MKLDEDTLTSRIRGCSSFDISRDELPQESRLLICVLKSRYLPSKGEMRKLVQSGGVSFNKEKLAEVDTVIDCSSLLDDKYLLVQRGKKNYYLLIAK